MTKSTLDPSTELQGYVPGVCNIGVDERKQRRRVGVVATISAVALFAFLLATNASKPWRLLLFFPVTGAAAGFLQDRFHFCAAYGFRGVANVFAPAGKTEDVMTAEFRKQDQRKALQILGYSVVTGIVVAAVAAAGA